MSDELFIELFMRVFFGVCSLVNLYCIVYMIVTSIDHKEKQIQVSQISQTKLYTKKVFLYTIFLYYIQIFFYVSEISMT